MQFADQRVYVLLAVALLVIALAANLAVARSRFGLSLLAIKQNEPAAMGAGINPRAWKLRAITLSAALTAMAGGLYAVVLLIVTPPTVFGMLASAQALIVTLFGGIATVFGPVLGALILVPLGETLHAELGNRLPGIQGVVYGAAIIAVVLMAPEGILPRLAKRWGRNRAAAAGAPLALDAAPYVRPAALPAVIEAKPLLEVGGVSVRFGGLQALQNVAFSVRAGEILGIIGPERRRQDDALQRAERLHLRRIGQREVRGPRARRRAAVRGVPRRGRAHVPDRAAVRAAHRCSTTWSSARSRSRPTTRRRTPARGRRSGAWGSPGAKGESHPRSPPSSYA